MDAKELRVGNLIYNEYTKQVQEVYPEMITQLSRLGIENNMKPIPLTEDWLLNFGFNYNDDDCVYLALKYRGFCIYSDDYDEFSIATIKVQNFRIVIKHVHQLQNLYFFLTTEELTIKEK